MESQSIPIIKVLLVGANGTLGTAILRQLERAGHFQVSILRRSGSTSAAPNPAVQVITVSREFHLEELEAAVGGQDAVVAAFPLKDVSQHLRLLEAAYRSRVRRYIPADFGSCDASSVQAQAHLQLYRDKTAVRDMCERLAEKASEDGLNPFTWTSIVCGHFFDHGLHDGLLHFDINTRKAQILDGGDIKASTSTLARVAESVVRVLEHPEVSHNRVIYVQSFCPTQLEILASLERATGAKWRTQHLDSNAYLKRESRRLAEGDRGAIEEIVFVLGTVNADWTRKDNFAMKLLGLEDEKLDDVVSNVVTAHASKAQDNTR